MKKTSRFALHAICRPWLSLARATSSHTMMATALLAAAPMVMVACADENEPSTWVKRLDDPAQRAGAIKRLNQFFEDALNKSNKDAESPEVKKLLDVMIEPLTQQYVNTALDEKTRKELIKFLADTRDKRALPAFTKALNEYEAGKNDEDAKVSAQAIANIAKKEPLTDQAAVDAVWTAFSKVAPSKTKMLELVRSLSDAVLAVKSPGWGPKAVEKLAVAVKNPNEREEGLDQIQFWQATSVRLIAELKFAPAVKPLVGVLLTPTKGNLRGVVNNALMQMPVEAEPVLIAALDGSDADFAAQAKEFGPDANHIAILADTLAYISRPKAKAAVLAAIEKTTNDTQRTVIAQSLIRFPADAKLKEAFVATYNKIPANTPIALLAGMDAHAALLQAAAQFYDPEMNKWILKEIEAAKGDMADAMHLYALEAAIKLMDKGQVAEVGAAAKKHGTPRETSMWENANLAVTACDKDAACYTKLLDEPIPSSPDTAKYKTVKACWMAAAYGNDATRAALVAKLPSIKDGAVRLSLVEAIDFLAPKGDAEAAKALDKVVEEDAGSGNRALIAANDAVVKVANRLRARSLP